jgi:hypothetical protein
MNGISVDTVQYLDNIVPFHIHRRDKLWNRRSCMSWVEQDTRLKKETKIGRARPK